MLSAILVRKEMTRLFAKINRAEALYYAIAIASRECTTRQVVQQPITRMSADPLQRGLTYIYHSTLFRVNKRGV